MEDFYKDLYRLANKVIDALTKQNKELIEIVNRQKEMIDKLRTIL